MRRNKKRRVYLSKLITYSSCLFFHSANYPQSDKISSMLSAILHSRETFCYAQLKKEMCTASYSICHDRLTRRFLTHLLVS